MQKKSGCKGLSSSSSEDCSSSMDHITFIIEWCRNRQHIHFCRRHGRHYHLSGHGHHHHHHHHPQHPHSAPQPGVPQPKAYGQRTVVAPQARMNPPREKTVWEENSPDSLLDLCSRYLLLHPETYCVRITSKAAAAEDVYLVSTAAKHDVDSTMESLPGSPVLSTHHPHLPHHPQALESSSLKLLPDLHLPAEICEKLFSILQEEGLDIEDPLAEVFGDTKAARLKAISVRGTSITDKGLKLLLKHNLRELDIHQCMNLSKHTLESLNENSGNLIRLHVGDTAHILPTSIVSPWEVHMDDEDNANGEDSLDEEIKARCVYEVRGYILNAPRLQSLSIHNLKLQRSGSSAQTVPRSPSYFDLLLRPLRRLNHLDLSGLEHQEGKSDFRFLLHLPQLASLVLHNVSNLQWAMDTIRTIPTLRHLDISQNDDKLGIYENPNRTLSNLVEGLVNLTSLDISGTNLAGTGVQEPVSKIDPLDYDKLRDCDIPGLVSRAGKPLEFLGLYKTCHEASCRSRIPALKVSGDSTEAQILVAGQQYLDRPLMLENVLNDLFHIFKFQNCVNLKAALDIILLAMDRHPREKVIQISGSASLYYIVKNDDFRDLMNIKMKKKILATLLNGMFAHKSDSVMMRNGCLTLCQFSIPNDVIFDYERLVRILLQIVSEHNQDENDIVQTASIYLLNSLACHVDRQQKLLVGNLGAMETMLAVVKNRVEMELCDTVMETAWSCMWNVTDETPHNCKRFLDGGGMKLFLECKEKFPSKMDLLRNMMGLLGNVAEVPGLRTHLMTEEFVAEFTSLLESQSDGIEVSYNAAGVLAHMASDGPDAWTVEKPSRKLVLGRMVTAINRWSLTVKRNINYRSFEPILRLVQVDHTPECQLWAVWALANLTEVDRRYCKLVYDEGGVTLLEELINRNLAEPDRDEDSKPSETQERFRQVIELSHRVRWNVSKWEEKQEKRRQRHLRARQEGFTGDLEDLNSDDEEDLQFDG